MNKDKSFRVNKIVLVALAGAVFAFVMWYSHGLVRDMQSEETKKMQLWADATQMLASVSFGESDVIEFLLRNVQQNTTIPVIVVDSVDNILLARNISLVDSLTPPNVLLRRLKTLKESGMSIEIPLDDGSSQYLYYSDSHIIRRLSYFPIVQMALVVLFVFFAYLVFSRARRSEQDKVWAGLARETAHQLGTPISALMGWTEILKSGGMPPEAVANEIVSDVDRLNRIADRFSKIGSQPEMSNDPIVEVVESVAGYLRHRVPSRVSIEVDAENGRHLAPLHNKTLMAWVVENLCRNAIDAIQGEGRIEIRLFADGKNTIIEVADNGKGMSRSTMRRVFNTGFTTKQRGWGIGLTLAQRIVEQYHSGIIFVKNSELGVGTTMRVVLTADGKSFSWTKKMRV